MYSLPAWNADGLQQESPEKRCLYSHFLSYQDQLHTEMVIDHFRQIFLATGSYPNAAVKAAIDTLVSQPDEEFIHGLNRCFYILVNHWRQESRSQPAILDLIKVLQSAGQKRPINLEGRRLYKKVQQFLASEEYQQICRVEQLYQQPSRHQGNDMLVRNLIPRYPFLFDYLFFSDPQQRQHEQGKTILSFQSTQQKKYKAELSVCQQRWQQGQSLAGVPNPTLLGQSELASAFSYYLGKVDHEGTHQDAAHHLQAQTFQMGTVAQYKEAVCDYLLRPLIAVDPTYTQRNLTPLLQEYLQVVSRDVDGLLPGPELQNLVCRRLLDFFVIDARKGEPTFNHHYRFIDMLGQLGHALMVGTVLRISLLLGKAQAQMEKRLAQLFKHYESHSQNDAELSWFIPVFEHMQVAIATNLQPTPKSQPSLTLIT